MSDDADPPNIAQDNRGDENVNIGSVEGNVTIDRSKTSMFEVKRPGFEAGLGVAIVGLAVTILTIAETHRQRWGDRFALGLDRTP